MQQTPDSHDRKHVTQQQHCFTLPTNLAGQSFELVDHNTLNCMMSLRVHQLLVIKMDRLTEYTEYTQ